MKCCCGRLLCLSDPECKQTAGKEEAQGKEAKEIAEGAFRVTPLVPLSSICPFAVPLDELSASISFCPSAERRQIGSGILARSGLHRPRFLFPSPFSSFSVVLFLISLLRFSLQRTHANATLSNPGIRLNVGRLPRSHRLDPCAPIRALPQRPGAGDEHGQLVGEFRVSAFVFRCVFPLSSLHPYSHPHPLRLVDEYDG